ncbi:MAG: alpha-L-fucosidase [Spirochaetes bacterium]|nr:alpha-L-fucosidase [Spirochaetota bacterium]
MSHPASHGPVPTPDQLAWHRRNTYGFIHFTQNTFTDREWGYGDETPAGFNPAELDCRQWVAAAKAGGLTALILTAKHHDGFCLWPTATTTHNVSRSPFRGGKGDVVRELSDACREGGIGFGVYCSPWDRNHPEYGRDAYVDVYHAQWKELLTGYGPLVELWFDGANGGDGYYGGAKEKRSIDAKTYYRFDELRALCRKHQPHAVLFSDAGPDLRWCGNESGYAGFTSWCRFNPAGAHVGSLDNYSRLPLGEADGSMWRPVEVDVSIRPGWFFHQHERPKTGDELFSIWLSSVGQNAGLLLNLAPDRRGLIPSEDVASLHRFRHLVESFTALDLAKKRPVTVSSTACGEASYLIDDNPDTYWGAAENTAAIEIDIGTEERIGGFRIDEAVQFGQRIEAFSVEVRIWQSWTEVFRGTTVGAQRIVKLNQARGRYVRIRILASQSAPILSGVSIYAAC